MSTPSGKGDYLALAEVRLWAASGSARQARERARLSQGEVAAAISVTIPTVSRWERGLRVPRGEGALRYHALLRNLAKQKATVPAA